MIFRYFFVIEEIFLVYYDLNMYLCGYVKKYGHLTFKEKPFSRIDAAILTMAVYSNFEVVAPSIHDKVTKAFLIKDISEFDLSVVVAGITFVLGNIKLIKLMRSSKRYGEIGVRYLDKVFSPELSNQFYALSFLIPDVGTFIAFRGTDTSVVGWEEDLKLSTHKLIPSQLDALDYLTIIAGLEKGPIYIGGHSKGGNICVYAATHASKDIRDRIVKAYSFDGVGFKDEDVLKNEGYEDIKDRLELIIPSDCFVGTMFYNLENPLIVKSRSVLVLQHNVHNWKIDKNGEFIPAKGITRGSKVRHHMLNIWLKDTPRDECNVLIRFFTLLFGGNNRTIFSFILSPKKIAKFRQTKNNFTSEERAKMRSAKNKLKAAIKKAKLIVKGEGK